MQRRCDVSGSNTTRVRPRARSPKGPDRCRRRFLAIFPGGFRDETYIEYERGYKEAASQAWLEELGPRRHRELLRTGRFAEVAATVVRIESRTNLLFSFEKMAVSDAVREPRGARAFAEGLYALLYGRGEERSKFERWCEVLAGLPRRQTRVLTWPVATVFPFIAQPDRHVFLKPNVTRVAAAEYGFTLEYAPRPSWETYASLLAFADRIRRDLGDLRPRDMIDVQSFVWVQGSDEYR
jgi:hypothetical protein